LIADELVEAEAKAGQSGKPERLFKELRCQTLKSWSRERRVVADRDNSDGPSLLSNVNPNFTSVRLAQRIPVRIHLTYVPPGVLISAGMTCTAIVKRDQQLRIGAGVKRLLSALL
jgi:multidrug resistance efflux pump